MTLGELMFTTAFLGNWAPYSATGMQPPYKLLRGTKPDVRLLRVIGAKAFVHTETYSKKLELKAVEGRPVGYSNNKSYRVYSPVTRHIMESRNVIFIEPPSRVLPPPSEVVGGSPCAASSIEERNGCPQLHHRQRLSARSLRLHFGVGTPYQWFCGPHHRRRALIEHTAGRTLGLDQRHHTKGRTGRRSRKNTAREICVLEGGRPRRRHNTRWSNARGSSAGGRSQAPRAATPISTGGASAKSSPAASVPL